MANKKVIEVDSLVDVDMLATAIVDKYDKWAQLRQRWLDDKQEILEYIFATSTQGTTNDSLPWKNSIHVPKLCQIRDNLHSNYMAALFPTERPIKWEGSDQESNSIDKKKIIESYIENKLRMGDFETTVSRIVLDLIDYGNSFGRVEYINEWVKDPITDEKITGFVGPRLKVISPLDIVFDPTAESFAKTPKIIRSLRTLGSIKAEITENPNSPFANVWDKIHQVRKAVTGLGPTESLRNKMYSMDGFASWNHYFSSGLVEVLEFFGDIYDEDTGDILQNQIVVVVDRSFIAQKIVNPSWLGKDNIFHCGWRLRPDNLYAMGPLDNLVGMQYRIDHLENAKADAFDLIIHPVMKIKGMVEDFEYGPGERIYTSEEGDVAFMSPDTTMLNADTQIAMYEQKMEEMAGAPKQAMGQRTPGEKTAYEVQILENGSQRIFLNKTAYFEKVFIEPALNSMLELARRNLSNSDTIRILDNNLGIALFQQITKEDITAKGKIYPVGARHFARNANIIQNLTNFANSSIAKDPQVAVHISGKGLAKLMEELLDVERFELVQDNIRIAEQLETSKLAQIMKSKLDASQKTISDSQHPDVTQAQALQGMMGNKGMSPEMMQGMLGGQEASPQETVPQDNPQVASGGQF